MLSEAMQKAYNFNQRAKAEKREGNMSKSKEYYREKVKYIKQAMKENNYKKKGNSIKFFVDGHKVTSFHLYK